MCIDVLSFTLIVQLSWDNDNGIIGNKQLEPSKVSKEGFLVKKYGQLIEEIADFSVV